jgi:DNA gyrase subunit B
MPNLIEKGYLYIAQPPLYKVGKGKKGKYLKDEDEYKEYILKRGCENKSAKIENIGEIIEEYDLYLLLGDLAEYYSAISNMEKRSYDAKLIELLMSEGLRDKIFLQDKERMLILLDTILNNGYDVGELIFNEERGRYRMNVTPKNDKNNGDALTIEKKVSVEVGRMLVYSIDYQQALIIEDKLSKYKNSSFLVSNRNDEKEEKPVLAKDKKELYNIMIGAGKKGLTIQRYKGLGEMNPDQLWTTTMDPEKRTMLQVEVEDAEKADEIFTLLMGEEVEPRRNFIQTNALDVANLDL